ncbi:glutathione-disulfide reductase [Coralloluteibacterium thermophilus]|uniref:Glutathione-disulfide reductase n=1 Tax=Coralloluteibacterium thermophilum TaxID=2707049 RepID=A0ABV9NKC6_9GAMM
MTQTHDLIVLGAGSGGMATAQRAAAHGAKVVVVEPGPVGGTCIHVGCVPKKATWLAAQLAYAQGLAREYGFPLTPAGLDWPRFVARRSEYIRGIEGRYRERFETLGIGIVAERGRLLGAGRVQAGARTLSAPSILVATGSAPVRPEVAGADLGEDSDGFFAWTRAPRRVAFIGGGYISVELAGMLCALGVDVTIYARERQLLAQFDTESADFLGRRMADEGVDVRCGASVDRLSREDDGIAVHCEGGAGGSRGFDHVVWAVGRRPRTQDIGLEEAGVRTDARGRIVVDHEFGTSAPGVYAVGDCTTLRPLTPVAVACGRRLADRLFGQGEPKPIELDLIPSVVFGHPPFASVGLSEREARERHGDALRIYRSEYRALRTGLAGRACASRIKLICAGDEERVVGLHIVGESADDVVQGFAVAMAMGATKRDFDRTVAVHPTVGEEVVTLA